MLVCACERMCARACMLVKASNECVHMRVSLCTRECLRYRTGSTEAEHGPDREGEFARPVPRVIHWARHRVSRRNQGIEHDIQHASFPPACFHLAAE